MDWEFWGSHCRKKNLEEHFTFSLAYLCVIDDHIIVGKDRILDNKTILTRIGNNHGRLRIRASVERRMLKMLTSIQVVVECAVFERYSEQVSVIQRIKIVQENWGSCVTTSLRSER